MGRSFVATLKAGLYSWWIAAIAFLAGQGILSLTLKQGPFLVAYCEGTYLILLLIACGVATLNAVQNRQNIRLFWSFLAAAYGLWAIVPCAWFYYVVLRGQIPAFLFDTPPLFLHIVMMIAAVASRPHLRLRSHRPYRATFNFLVLLFVWVFAYTFLLFPYRYASMASTMILRFEGLYFTENLLLLLILGILVFRSQPPWKSIYSHLFGASALYLCGSFAMNLVWALKDPSGDMTGNSFPAVRGLMGMVLTAAMTWLVWIGLRGRRLAPQLTQTVQLDTTNPRYSSALAMLAALAIPIVGVWELVRTDEPFGTHEVRLLIVMIAGLLLGIAVFIQDYLANREFTSDVSIAHDRLRLAMESGKSVAWEWDIATGQDLRSGDLRTMFGIESDTHIGNAADFLSSVHPEDRALVEKALVDAKVKREVRAVEFRVVWPDGTVRWIATSWKCYYTTDDSPERVLGMAVDITDRKQAEQAIRESEERFRLVANTAPVLIWMSGVDRLCTYFNKPWLDFTGRSFEEEIGNGWVEGVHPEDLQKCLETYTQAFDRKNAFRMEYRLRRHDGEFRWILDIGVPRFGLDSSFAGYIGSAIDVTERKLAEEALSNVSSRLIEAQELERTRIARDLHDDIAQRLALLAIDLQRLKTDLPGPSAEALSQVDELRKRTTDIATDIQSLSHHLHSPKLEYLGVVAAMRGFCQEFGAKQKLQIDFRSHDVPSPIPPNVSLCLFRVMQEALHNGVKHSGTNSFAIKFWGTEGELHLTIADTGVGFDVEAAMKGRGLGLVSMQERVRVVNGTISIESKVKGGTEIGVRVPVSSDIQRVRMNLSA